MDFDEYYRDLHPTEFDDPNYRWHPRNPIELLRRQQLSRAILWALSKVDQPLERLRILDVGCGSGAQLRLLLEFGASAELLHGVDVLEARVQRARAINPGIQVNQVDATAGLPFPDGSFDLVAQFVAFSSILAAADRRRVASEMLRVLAPRGWIVSYDTVVPNPGHVPDGLNRGQIAELFPGIVWVGRRPLHNRALAKLSPWPLVAETVEHMPWVPKTNLVLVGQRAG